MALQKQQKVNAEGRYFDSAKSIQHETGVGHPDRPDCTPHSQHARGLFGLPREIGDAIYEECLVSGNMINLMNLKDGCISHPQIYQQKLGIWPQILLTSKMVHIEASEILYGSNTFYVDAQPMWRYTRQRRIRKPS